MIDCPAPETLRLFLDERLTEHDFQQIMDHLEACDACQRTVHGLVFETAEGERGVATLRDEGLDDRSGREILDAIARNAPPCPMPIADGAVGSDVVFPAEPTDQGLLGKLGVYHIQEKIGSGTYGLVFKAFDEKLARTVALKVLRPELAALPGARTRFEREARAAAKLNNPHVIVIYGVFDATVEFPCPYIAMEYVDGKSLHALLRANPHGLNPKVAARLTRHAARGLAAAHAHGIVHRDVKPENILLRGPYDDPQLKITDFGIAQVVEAAARSPHGSIIGTLPYMSPEAFVTPFAVDGRSDIFSLGVTFYQLLTGRMPSAGAMPVQPARTGGEQRFVPPRQINPQVPADLEAVVLKCLARSPKDRYETAAELAEQLGRWLRNEPVEAWHYGSRDLIKLWYHRNRKSALWVAAFLVAFTAFLLALGAGLYLRAESDKAQRKIVADYWNTAEEQQKDGRFGEAAATMEMAVSILERNPRMASELSRFEARRDHFRRLHEFTRSSDQAWFFAGEERGERVGTACEKALGCFGVLERSDWESQQSVRDLSPDTAARVRGEIHRLLLLMAGMRIQHALLAFRPLKLGSVQENAQRVDVILERARAMENNAEVSRSKTAALLEKGANRLSNPSSLISPSVLLAGIARSPVEHAEVSLMEDLSAEDGFFLGVMHVYLAKHRNDPLAKVIKLVGPSEFDYKTPRTTATDMLRLAVQLEPRHYWSRFMLGRILAFPAPDGKADYHEALQVFNACVSLRPDYSRGYEQRALTLVQLSLEATTPARRTLLRRQASEDLHKAFALAPDDPSTHWVRAQAFELLRDTPNAMSAYIRALELEHDLQEKVSRRNQLKAPTDLVDRVLKKDPNHPAALRLSTLIARARAT
jgi:serine/threonine protein kinase